MFMRCDVVWHSAESQWKISSIFILLVLVTHAASHHHHRHHQHHCHHHRCHRCIDQKLPYHCHLYSMKILHLPVHVLHDDGGTVRIVSNWNYKWKIEDDGGFFHFHSTPCLLFLWTSLWNNGIVEVKLFSEIDHIIGGGRRLDRGQVGWAAIEDGM